MASGICIFAEHYAGNLEIITAELITAARVIRQTTGEKIMALVVSQDCSTIIKQLEPLGLDEVYVVETDRDCTFQDDALSRVVADMIRQAAPASVLVPATTLGRSIFSRVAVQLGCGLTADCTDLKVGTRDDGSHFIKQNKPSYGDNVMVTIVTRENIFPQMMTVRPGVYEPYQGSDCIKPEIKYLDIVLPESGIKVIEQYPAEAHNNSIVAAEIVVIGGRGAEEEENFSLLKAFADKIDGVVGGTRPLADTGFIPFECQVGQTGCTIRPDICISLGVSGAIQHTEGIKDTKLFIAVNKDKNAPIFNVADYGVIGDMKGILKSLLAD